MSKLEFIERFLAISSWHLQLTEQSTADITQQELEELLEIINASHGPSLCPDQ